jgi:hypothetical protein
MLSADRLTLAIDLQSKSYQLLRWLADGMDKGIILPPCCHHHAQGSDAVFEWLDKAYSTFPSEIRPARLYVREFANFFGTYLTSSFDIIESPGTRFRSHSGCYCPICTHIVHAPHLQPKKLSKRDKSRAIELMLDRVTALASEEGIAAQSHHVTGVVEGEATRRYAAYSAYGHWLIKRLEGDTDGKSILALWREIAWKRTGSPIKGFKLRYEDFVTAEELLTDALQTAMLSS